MLPTIPVSQDTPIEQFSPAQLDTLIQIARMLVIPVSPIEERVPYAKWQVSPQLVEAGPVNVGLNKAPIVEPPLGG